MKKILLPLLMFVLVSSSCNAQPEVRTLVNDANAEKRTVAAFKGVQVSNAITLYISQGNEDAVAVSCSDASENKKIKTEVKNGILHISLDNGFWNSFSWKDKKVKAYVSIKNIEFLGASGASSVKINEVLKSSNLKIDISGASNIKGNISATTIKIDLSGTSSASIVGFASSANIEASGASSVKSYDFEVENCVIEASGASSIGIGVRKELKAEASGASSIRYKGTPANVEANATGASSIKKKTD